ncbi:MAG: phage Gp37/Gp68 family protein [Gammaproteobacteria bacterium]|nr:phage Gp37/Gp68 family protein [Gammaproteobacteria bacterium]
MAEQSAIEWCDSTFNPWIGCTKVSPACDNCYAAVSTPARTMGIEWGVGKPRQRTSESNWHLPVKWNASKFYQCQCGWRGAESALLNAFAKAHTGCPSCGRLGELPEVRRRVFCSSLADVFDNETPIEWLADLLELIMQTPNLDWLLLTKRIGNWRPRLVEAKWCALRRHKYLGCLDSFSNSSYQLVAFMKAWCGGRAPENVWIGATICNQDEANRDISKLLKVPARIRFLSIEPMLGAINLLQDDWITPVYERCINFVQGVEPGYCGNCHGHETDLVHVSDAPVISWVICGGESGKYARPMHPDWVRSLRDQCEAAGVPFLFKQWGEFLPSCDYDDEDDAARDAALDGKETLLTRGGHIWQVGAPGTDERHDGQPPVGTWITHRIGKKNAGRLLDGRTWDQYPSPGDAL